ncbi:hypothetical protein BIW11_05307 [Tropilaelaps mercedesae]|uniref:Uncharacterized protein n=1 Tax=Tropilaelaps mercedesae TaxID=418985 RepID=A0A1V9Y2T9_9ACAR|nr:hypothetical protein BIW11_05307 [Tropilaelaps mercedesae]
MMFQGVRAVTTRFLALQTRRQMSSSASTGQSRRMVYPYTFTAKFVQFPHKFHYDNIWLFKYFVPSYLITMYIFWKIQRLSYSPENVKLWEERRAKEFARHDEH